MHAITPERSCFWLHRKQYLFPFLETWKQSETPVQKRKKVLFLVQPKKQELSDVDVDVDRVAEIMPAW